MFNSSGMQTDKETVLLIRFLAKSVPTPYVKHL